MKSELLRSGLQTENSVYTIRTFKECRFPDFMMIQQDKFSCMIRPKYKLLLLGYQFDSHSYGCCFKLQSCVGLLTTRSYGINMLKGYFLNIIIVHSSWKDRWKSRGIMNWIQRGISVVIHETTPLVRFFSLRFLFPYPIQVYFGMLDALLASEELPEEYRDRCQVRQAFYI